ncbi:metallophosphoesterase [Carnobacteriaceae bacterium zg-ZUI252]|nr:metallophosphoesterase [Carnobacteriaceae bacterium zg-ZUI252]
MVTRILVISDNHGIDNEMAQLLADYRQNVDYIVHCGDSEFPTTHSTWSLVDSVVKGNMDFDAHYSVENIINMPFGKVYSTHGHLCRVNFSREHLATVAKQNGAKLAFYGHTHVLCVEKIDDVICINPGSFNHSRGNVPERTYAIVTIDEQNVSVTFFNHKRQHLEKLDKTLRVE